MHILAIDTALARCSVAFGDPGNAASLTVRSVAMERGHAEALVPMVEEVLAAAGAIYTDADRIAVTVGPGSFTGLRVGVAAARGIALAARRPLVAVDTLAALAEGIRPAVPARPIAAVIDARRGEIYAALYGAAGETLLEPSALVAADFADALAESGLAPVLTGSAAAIVAPLLLERGCAHEVADEAAAPPVEAVLRLGERLAATTTARPLYLRPPDAKPQTRFRIARQCC
ncbi:MAG: tRNA (adenosine(37)-N6)-threonylcarbamoyltransferase complex dimerization subunit type 1 TsaB [Hyphomicrobiales bacterium]